MTVRKDSHNGDGVVVKDSRDIFGGKLVGRIADEQTGLANSTIADDDTPRRTGKLQVRDE